MEYVENLSKESKINVRRTLPPFKWLDLIYGPPLRVLGERGRVGSFVYSSMYFIHFVLMFTVLGPENISKAKTCPLKQR